jgi:hypothetical protein
MLVCDRCRCELGHEATHYRLGAYFVDQVPSKSTGRLVSEYRAASSLPTRSFHACPECAKALMDSAVAVFESWKAEKLDEKPADKKTPLKK